MSKPSMFKKIVFIVFMLAASGVSARLSALEFSIRPGGFIGYLEVVSASAEIKNCYATGNVTVSNRNNILHAGGLLGNARGSGTGDVRVEQCAGEVRITGEGEVFASGLIGEFYAAELKITNCYALADMRLEYSSDYNDPNPIGYTPSTGDVGVNHKNGANAAASAFKTAGFWTETLDFDTSIWNMDGVGRRGYPTLTGMGGQ